MDLFNINLNLLKPFWAVYKTGGINKAAKMLDMAPPAVTYNIKQLENQLGVKLFNTHKKGADPTTVAAELFPFIEGVFDNLAKCNEHLNTTNKGTLRIGISTTILSILLAKFIPVFKRKYPDIMFELHHHPKNDYLTMLANDKIDAAIMQMPKTSVPIKTAEITALNVTFYTTKKFAAEHGLTNEISLQQFQQRPFIMFGKSGLVLAQIEQVLDRKLDCVKPLSSFAAFHMVMDGQGIGLHFEKFLDNQNTDAIMKLAIKDAPPLPPAIIECAYTQKPSAIVALFVKELKEFYLCEQ